MKNSFQNEFPLSFAHVLCLSGAETHLKNIETKLI